MGLVAAQGAQDRAGRPEGGGARRRRAHHRHAAPRGPAAHLAGRAPAAAALRPARLRQDHDAARRAPGAARPRRRRPQLLQRHHARAHAQDLRPLLRVQAHAQRRRSR